MGNYDSALPGLYDYKAATWGDGLFLSLGAGGFCTLRTLFPSKSQVSAAVGVLLFLLGSAVQLSWLFDQNIALNWTIPEPGRFNAAGLYHAIYFSVCFGFFGWNVAAEICDKQNHVEYSYYRSIVYYARLAIWIALAGYLQMHLLDNWPNAVAQPWLSLLGAVLIFFVALVYAVTMRRYSVIRFVSIAALITCGFSLALCSGLSLVGDEGHLIIIVALILLFSFESTPSRKEEIKLSILLGITASMGLLAIAACISAFKTFSVLDPLHQFGVCLFCSLLFALSGTDTAHLANGGIKRIALSFVNTLCATVYLSCFDVLAEIIKSTGLIPIVASFPPITALAGNMITPEWVAERLVVYMTLVASLIALAGEKIHGVHAFESSLGTSALESKSLALMKLTVFLQILVACVGGMLILLTEIYSFAVDSLPSGAIFMMLESLKNSSFSLFVGAAASCFLSVIMGYSLRGKNIRFARLLPVLLVILSCFFLFCYVTEFRRPLEIAWWWAAALFPLIGSSLFIAEAFLSNVSLLWGYSCDSREMLLAFAITVGCFLTAFGSTIPTEGLEGQYLPIIMSLGIGIAGCFFAFVALPVACALIVDCDKQPKTSKVPTNSPVIGVLQNGTAAFALIILIATLPLDIFASLRTVLVALVSVCMLLSRKIPMALFPLAVNVKHLAKRKQAIINKGQYAEERENVLSLSRHMQRQAILTALSLMPWFVFVVIGNTSMQKDILSISLEETYLLRKPSRSAMLLFAELLPIERAEYNKELEKLGEELLPAGEYEP